MNDGDGEKHVAVGRSVHRSRPAPGSRTLRGRAASVWAGVRAARRSSAPPSHRRSATMRRRVLVLSLRSLLAGAAFTWGQEGGLSVEEALTRR